jgi:hypothetical protein
VRRRFGIFLIGLLVAVSRGLAAGSLPAVEGAITGELKLFPQLPDFALPWKLSLGAAAGGAQTFTFALDAAGTRLRASGQVELATGDGSWRIDEAQVDAAAWLGALAPRLGPAFSGVVALGTVGVTGTGTLRQGQVVGGIKVEWRGGYLRNTEQGWAFEGIVFEGDFEIDGGAARLVSTTPFELTIGTITTARFGARNFSLHGWLNEQRTLSVRAARVEIAGGELTADPFEIPLPSFAINANVRINRVGLQDIVLLVPAAGLAEARGRIDGVARVKWTEGVGIQLGVGHLTIRDDEPAIVRLTPAPGLLTGHVPEYFDLLPTWMGPLSRWVRQVDPAFGNMQSLELGQADLRVKTLNVLLTPEGDDKGRSATVRLVAQPASPHSAVKEVTFDVNVAGPLNAVLKLGIDRGFTLDAH